MNLCEAFRALDALNEDTFSFTNDGIEKLSEFEQNDDLTDDIKVIDTEAETEDDLQDSYVGKVILDCSVCHSKLYKDKEEVELNDEEGLANVGEECPYCYTSDGFKVIGEVSEYNSNVEDKEDDEDSDEVDESLIDVKADVDANVTANGNKVPVLNTSLGKDSIKESVRKRKLKIIESNDVDTNDLKGMKKVDEGIFSKKKSSSNVKKGNHDDVKSSHYVIVSEDENGKKRLYTDSKASDSYSITDHTRRSEQAEPYNSNLKLTTMTVKEAEGIFGDLTRLVKHAIKNESVDIKEAAFSGGVAGDSSFSGGTVRGRGASTQPSKKNYLDRLKSKNPKLVEITTIKGKDVKPGMITQAGQVKEAKVDYSSHYGKDMVYIMHTNNYDGFWDVDEDMPVMVDPNNKSKPFMGNYKDLLSMGLNESVNNVNVETDDSIVNVSTDDSGKVTVTTEPNNSLEGGDDVLSPLSDETEAALGGDIEDEPIDAINGEGEDEATDEGASEESSEDGESVEADVEDFDEESFDELGESYLRKIYENVDSYKTTKVASKGNKLFVEGNIKFNSGKVGKTSFIFEAKDITKSGTARFIGENKNITRGKKSFTIKGKLNEGKFISESLNYNYRTKDNDGKSTRVYGTVKVGKRG